MDEKDYVTRDQAEFLIKKYQETIKSFDTIKSEINDLMSTHSIIKSQISAISDSTSTHSNSLNKSLTQYSSTMKSHDDMFNVLTKRLDVLSKTMETLSNAIKDLSNNHQETRNGLSIAQRDLLDLKSKSASNEKLDILAKNHNDRFISINKKNEEISVYVKSLKDSLNSLITEHAALSSESTSNVIQTSKLNDSVKQIQQMISSEKARSMDSYSTLENSLKKYVDGKIPDTSNFVKSSDLKDPKNDISELILPVSLDAKNAVLRSQNCQSEVDLMKKKIENIQLLLKQQQLGTQ
jgi:chromosome segregation ATPase